MSIYIYIYHIYPHVRGHRAAVRAARRGEAAVERGVVRVTPSDVFAVRLRHRVLGHIGQDRLELGLEAVVVGQARRVHAEQREKRDRARVGDRAGDQAIVQLGVERVVVAMQQR